MGKMLIRVTAFKSLSLSNREDGGEPHPRIRTAVKQQSTVTPVSMQRVDRSGLHRFCRLTILAGYGYRGSGLWSLTLLTVHVITSSRVRARARGGRMCLLVRVRVKVRVRVRVR